MKTQHHRLLLLSLLAAGAPTLGACGALPLDLRDILPDDASISLRVPGSQLPGNTGGFSVFRPLVGATSEYHANAASIASVVNTNVLDLVRRIRGIAEYPPNSTQGNTYVWGPYSPGGLDTLNYRFTATKTAPSRYAIRLDARPGSDSSPDAFKNLLDGEVEGILGAEDADKGSGKGKGTFNVHFDNRRAVDPNWLARGEVGIVYDSSVEPRSIDVNLRGFDPSAAAAIGGSGGGGLGGSGLHHDAPADAVADTLVTTYRYTEDVDTSGTFLFSLRLNIQDASLPAAELVTLQARWDANGHGRADSTVTGEDVPAQLRAAGIEGNVIHSTECWDDTFAVVFQDSSPAELRTTLRALEGDPNACAFTNVEYPAAP
jgi:hypothetical protein